MDEKLIEPLPVCPSAIANCNRQNLHDLTKPPDQPKMVYDYSELCRIPFDEILSYLNVKEQIKCKAVCRNWKREVERWERSRQSLVFHLHAFQMNVKWSNGANLMRLENSFPIKSLDFLRRPATQNHLKQLRRVAILDMHLSYLFGNQHQRFGQCINWLVECEELELFNLYLEGKTTFDFPKLKVCFLYGICLLNNTVIITERPICLFQNKYHLNRCW